MGESRRSAAQLERDAALSRMSRARRWAIAAAAALTAGVTALVAAIAPGRSLGHSASSQPQAAGAGSRSASVGAGAQGQLPPLASAKQLGLGDSSQSPGLAAPPQPPAPSQPATPAPGASDPAAVSGGS
jgi:hypothetical protein